MSSDRRDVAAAVDAFFTLWHVRGEPLLQLLPTALLPWYGENARKLPWRKDHQPYHIWLSEIMLQQTRAETVKPYYERFVERFPDIQSLAKAPEDVVFKLWEGLGYYSRARNLLKTARILAGRPGGSFPHTYDELLKLPGVGEYTAGAIASICYGYPVPAVDGNVLRVVSRITELSLPVDYPRVRRETTEALRRVYPAGRCGDFTQSLMEIGAMVCLPTGVPRCGDCPASGFCLARANDTVSMLPAREKKKARKIEDITVLVLTAGRATAVRRRKNSGLLAGMWELPNVSGFRTSEEAAALAAEWGAEPTGISDALEKKHVFTHCEWRMYCYYVSCGARPPQFAWATEEELQKDIALPSAFRVCLTK